jgi:hypothetical protein
MNILVIMTRNRVTRKKGGNKTKRPNRIRRGHGSSSRRTRVKRGGMHRRLATVATVAAATAVKGASPKMLNSNAFKSIQEARTFFYHSIVPLFAKYEYHVTSTDPNQMRGEVVEYGKKYYNSPFPEELYSEFNQLKSVIDKTIKDETNPVQISGRLFDLYTKVKTALDEEKRKNDDKENIAPTRSLSAPATFRPTLQNGLQYLQPKTPSNTKDSSVTSGYADKSMLGPFMFPPLTRSPNPSIYTDYSTVTTTPPRLPPKTSTSIQNVFSPSPLPPAILFNNDATPQSSPVQSTPQSLDKKLQEDNSPHHSPVRLLNLDQGFKDLKL